MFQKNDKNLLLVRRICIGISIFYGIAAFIAGVFYMSNEMAGTGILIWLGGGIAAWLSWVFSSLYLSYLADIKLIRNKLYDVKNDALKDFLDEENKQTNNQAQ